MLCYLALQYYISGVFGLVCKNFIPLKIKSWDWAGKAENDASFG